MAKTAYEQLDEYQKRAVDAQVKQNMDRQPSDPQPITKIKARTTKQLTQDLAFFNYRLRQVEDMVRILNGRTDSIDAAAYMSVTALERKGQLKAIEKMNRKLQLKVASKIDTTRNTIAKYNDELIELEKQAVEEQMQQAKEHAEQAEKTEGNNGEEDKKA